MATLADSPWSLPVTVDTAGASPAPASPWSLPVVVDTRPPARRVLTAAGWQPLHRTVIT